MFVGHGLQKLRGAFGGPGLDGTERMMSALDMEPAPLQARAAALTETLGGAALAIGAVTPVAAAGLIATMLTAVRKVHWKNGFWNSKGGFEFNTVLIAVVTAVTVDGPGPLSIDSAFGRRRWGVRGGLFAVAAGAVGSLAAVELGRRASAALRAHENAQKVVDPDRDGDSAG